MTLQITPFYRHSLDAVRSSPRSTRPASRRGATQHRRKRRRRDRCHGLVNRREGQRIHWRQRVSPAKQRGQSRSDAVGEHVRVDRPHQHRVPHLAHGRCTGARVICRADDDRAGLECGPHTRQLRRPGQAPRRPPHLTLRVIDPFRTAREHLRPRSIRRSPRSTTARAPFVVCSSAQRGRSAGRTRKATRRS